MACAASLFVYAVLLALPFGTLGGEFLEQTQENSGSGAAAEPGAAADPEEAANGSVEDHMVPADATRIQNNPSSSSSGEPGVTAAPQERFAPTETPAVEAVSGDVEGNSSLRPNAFSVAEAGVQGAGKRFLAKVCAALNCRRGLPLSHARNFGSAAVGKSGGTCVVAFQGTASMGGVMQDVASNAMVGVSGCPGCRVGAGFKFGYKAVARRIKGALHRLGCHAVAVTGHSLGAAKAILCMYDLAKSGFHVTTSYVFGEPRVGNGAFVAAFNSVVRTSVFRVVHGLDPIVKLGGLGAQNVGREIYEDGESSTTDHLHYAGANMARCMPRGVAGGADMRKRLEETTKQAERSARCCLTFQWNCCIRR